MLCWIDCVFIRVLFVDLIWLEGWGHKSLKACSFTPTVKINFSEYFLTEELVIKISYKSGKQIFFATFLVMP